MSLRTKNIKTFVMKHYWLLSQQTFVGLQDVLKTSSTRLQPNNFMSSKTSWRRFQDLSQDVFKTSWKTKNCYAEDVLKTYLENVFKTSRRKTKFLLVISVSNKSKCVSNKSLFHKLYLRNLRRIQNASLRTQ